MTAAVAHCSPLVPTQDCSRDDHWCVQVRACGKVKRFGISLSLRDHARSRGSKDKARIVYVMIWRYMPRQEFSTNIWEAFMCQSRHNQSGLLL